MKDLIVGVVGPCGAGKSTLVAALKERGIKTRHIAQEHSYVKDMWKRLARPDVLIYLEVNYENTVRRRRLDWTELEYLEQLRRLGHARQFADLVIDTNALTVAGVVQATLRFLDEFNG